MNKKLNDKTETEIINKTEVEKKDEKNKEEIEEEIPEFISLLQNFTKEIKDLNNSTLNFTEKIKNLPTNSGISYLDSKNQLLLSYCINLSYIMLLKATGESINKKQLLSQLIELRIYLEQIKPIDEKMKFQISKLVSIANDVEKKDNKKLFKRPGPNLDFEAKKDEKKEIIEDEKDENEDGEENEDENEDVDENEEIKIDEIIKKKILKKKI
jgi:hypothetical protein